MKISYYIILSMALIVSIMIFIIFFNIKNIDNRIFIIFHLFSVLLMIYGTHLGAKWADRI